MAPHKGAQALNHMTIGERMQDGPAAPRGGVRVVRRSPARAGVYTLDIFDNLPLPDPAALFGKLGRSDVALYQRVARAAASSARLPKLRRATMARPGIG